MIADSTTIYCSIFINTGTSQRQGTQIIVDSPTITIGSCVAVYIGTRYCHCFRIVDSPTIFGGVLVNIRTSNVQSTMTVIDSPAIRSCRVILDI
ncbi:MAG: hypothetical protein A4E27_01516 [Methanobacterium sp. PtaU1.Bin242]|nr:MAG: hypothetical protein A4E27_01516 [Methanobacterium sp. PtaU1.Bin242]